MYATILAEDAAATVDVFAVCVTDLHRHMDEYQPVIRLNLSRTQVARIQTAPAANLVNQRWLPLTGSTYAIRNFSAFVHDSNEIPKPTPTLGVRQHAGTNVN